MHGPIRNAIVVSILSLSAAVARVASAGETGGGGSSPVKLDVLFVIDSSGSMREEQEKLAANFPLFIQELEQVPGGMPDVHIGVVSADTGIGQTGGGCDPIGDDGRLQNGGGTVCGVAGYYLAHGQADDGGVVTNYQGSLADAFGCIALLGSSACGFEQHLESMKRALDGHNPQNQGFLRDDAYLAVIFIADEDDCSALDAQVFDPSQTEVVDPLGPFGSFRCSEFGLLCDGGPISRSPDTYAVCEPWEESPYLHHPSHYVEYLLGLKDDPSKIVVGVVAGNTAPVAVDVDAENQPTMLFSCGSPDDGSLAIPAIRLKWFAERFEFHTFQSICVPDFAEQVTYLGSTVRAAIEDPPEPGPEPVGAGAGCSVSSRSAPAPVAVLLLAICAMRISSGARRRSRSSTPGGRGTRCTPRAAGGGGSSASRSR
jgi:hypothetical protein